MSLDLKDSANREKIIRESFEKIAEHYDLLNNLLSLGLQNHWKSRLIRRIHPQNKQNILDLAGGTGDVARRMIPSGADISILDPSEPMISVAKNRHGDRLSYYQNEGEEMPFEDASFDVVCISFGIRNARSIDLMLREVFRVLKKGGRFYCLEFSKPYPFFAPFYFFYLKYILPLIGQVVSGDRIAYRYLGESISAFLSQRELAKKISGSHFQNVRYENLSLGIVAIHSGIKEATNHK